MLPLAKELKKEIHKTIQQWLHENREITGHNPDLAASAINWAVASGLAEFQAAHIYHNGLSDEYLTKITEQVMTVLVKECLVEQEILEDSAIQNEIRQ